mmetsp:Transcript_14070/g.33215  ORF Transcript_14070/g.33215 Transcript_14070/m.33215 type:complete len:328 (-) Transcript_14070:78-1061(-)
MMFPNLTHSCDGRNRQYRGSTLQSQTCFGITATATINCHTEESMVQMLSNIMCQFLVVSLGIQTRIRLVFRLLRSSQNPISYKVVTEASSAPRLPLPSSREQSDGLIAPHATQKLQECRPVIEHQVTHPEKRDLHQAACAGALPKGGMGDPLERVVVITLQGILPGEGHVHEVGSLDHLLEKPLWTAAPVVRVLAVPHLHACEVQPDAVLLRHVHEVVVPAAVAGVVVASGQLRCMAHRLEPPVDAGQLCPKAARRLKLIDHMTVVRHACGGMNTLHPWPVHRGRCCRQDAVRVLDEHTAVPREEKVPVGRVPVPGVTVEEARLPRL